MIKLLPSNIEAEKTILASILLDNDQLLNIPLIPAHFHTETHKEIYTAMVILHKKGISIDTITLHAKLEEYDEYLLELATMLFSVPTLKDYIEIIKDCYYKRELINKSQRLINSCYDGEKVDESMAELNKVSKDDENKAIVSVYDVIDSMLDKRDNGPVTKTPTGYKRLDSTLNGGFSPGNLVCIAGRPGMGKTTVMLNFAYNQLMEGDNVAFVSYEMSELDMAQRYACLASGLSYKEIETRTERARQAMQQVQPENLYLVSASRSVDTLITMIRKMKKMYDINVVYIDYLQLMIDQGKSNNVDQSIGHITNSLKSIALELQIIVVIGSQLNRESDKGAFDKRPKLHNLRGSGNIEQDCDLVIILFREDYYDEDDSNGDIDVNVAKHRNGQTGFVKLKFIKEQMKIESIQQYQRSL